MALGLLLMDLLYLLLLGTVATASSFAAYGAWLELTGVIPVPVALLLSVVTFGLTWLAVVLVVAAILPHPKPGRYRVMGHPVFFVWVLHMLLRRCLDLPPLSMLVAQSNVLRFLSLRAMGARVHFTASMSSDALVLDPALLEVGPGSILGSQTLITGHYVRDDHLVLETVRIGANAELAARCTIAPGATIGDRASIAFNASIGPHVRIGAGAVIGPTAAIAARCRIEEGARVPMGAQLAAGTVVAAEEPQSPAASPVTGSAASS